LQQVSGREPGKRVGDPDPSTSLPRHAGAGRISASGSDTAKTPQDPPLDARATTSSVVSSPRPRPAPAPATMVSAMNHDKNKDKNKDENKDGNHRAEQANKGRVLIAPPDVAAPPADAQVTASGLAMKVLKPGSGTDHPAGNDCVTVSFKAWKRDGTLFSTSTTMNDSDVLCLNAAMLGVSEALKEMVVGEQRRLWIPEDLTFRTAHHHVEKRPEDEEPPRK